MDRSEILFETIVCHGRASFARITLIFFVVLIMLAAHIGEMAVWSLAIYGLGLIPDPHTAYYYVTETYTTLGYRDAVLPQSLRSLTGWLATTGILMFAWSTAILTAVINRILSVTKLLP